MALTIIYDLIVLLASHLIKRLVLAEKKLPRPPGPKDLPLVGNIADLPQKGCLEWQHWIKHKDLYSPISSINVLDY